MKSNRVFTQVKMRGKKTMTLRCGCCEAINFKWRERLKQANKEIKNGT